MNINKLLSAFIVLLFTLAVGIHSAEAVPASVKAKSEYLLADKQFNDGNFAGAIEHAEKSLAILGKTNSRIQYLLTKAYVATDQPDLAFAAIETFFEITPESMSGSDQYNEMVEQYSVIEESVRNLREAEEKDRISQDIKYCKAICWTNVIPSYRQKQRGCRTEAEKKNKSAGEGVKEVFNVLTLGLADSGSTVDELTKPCTDNAWNVLRPSYDSCASHCQEQSFRQTKLQKAASTHLIPLLLGESEIMGYQFAYTAWTIEIGPVTPDSPSEIAGLATGDFIIAIDGSPIEHDKYVHDIRDKVISGEIESAVLDVRRDGQKMEYLLKK